MPADPTPPAPPAFKRAALHVMLGSWQSWTILKYFCTGEGYATLRDVAEGIGLSPQATSKQLDRLIETGIITKSPSRIYKLRAGLQPDRAVPVLDFGHCLLRLNHPDPE